MLLIACMSALTIALCIAFFCEINGGVCGKTWDKFKEKFNPDNDEEKYDYWSDQHPVVSKDGD